MAPHALRPGEEEWQEVFENLQERFPTVDVEKVAQTLRDNDGHAGKAAAALRDYIEYSVGDKIRDADPDDREHVATLLSSPVMFAHACKENFRKFDVNRDGVLDFSEVLALTKELYGKFGLEAPSEGSLRGFFDATDENNDGVLSEKEFKKFFEMFLRYAFFDVHKLRQIVEEGKRKRSLMEENQKAVAPVSSSMKADKAERQHRSSEKEQRSSDSPQVAAPSRSRRSSDEGKAERSSSGSTTLSTGREVRCIASRGVTYRRTPEFGDRAGSQIKHGESVKVLEHWVKTSAGWLPMFDSHGQPLFASDGSTGVQISESHADNTADQAAPIHESAEPAEEMGEGGGGGGLRPGEEEWQGLFTNLQERFPAIPAETIAQVLRENGGHGGQAAKALRDLS